MTKTYSLVNVLGTERGNVIDVNRRITSSRSKIMLIHAKSHRVHTTLVSSNTLDKLVANKLKTNNKCNYFWETSKILIKASRPPETRMDPSYNQQIQSTSPSCASFSVVSLGTNMYSVNTYLIILMTSPDFRSHTRIPSLPQATRTSPDGWKRIWETFWWNPIRTISLTKRFWAFLERIVIPWVPFT